MPLRSLYITARADTACVLQITAYPAASIRVRFCQSDRGIYSTDNQTETSLISVAMIAMSGNTDIRLGPALTFLFLDQRALASGILLKGEVQAHGSSFNPVRYANN